MTQEEILRYARAGILHERHFCQEMREKVLSLVDAYGETARKLADDYKRDIADLDAKLKELDKLAGKE